MKKATIALILVSLFLFPFTTQASEGIPLQKDVILGAPIYGPQDLPEEITFTLYDAQNGLTALGSQTFARGQYTVDFEFSQSNGVTGGNVARVKADFTNILNLKDASGQPLKPKEIWAALEVGGTEVGARTKVPDETLVRLLLNSDASLATYLTLAYEGDTNPITTIYKDLPISLTAADGSKKTLSDYFSGVVGGTVGVHTAGEGALTDPNNWYPSGNNIYYTYGNVGIGTSSPGAKLHLQDNGGSTAIRIRNYLSGDSSDQLSQILGGRTSNGKSYLAFGTTNTGVYSEKVRISESGNVGIGKTSPEAKLDVLRADIGYGIKVKNTSGSASMQLENNSGKKWHTSVNTSDNSWTFTETDVAHRIVILPGGSVGIGTLNPGSYNLAVEGKIGCRELTVTNAAWADFVFEENYSLPPLNEVEQFISENKHLPGIPTEAEVKENGVSVGNISSKLLQKIEELTLYVIDIKKENSDLKAKLAGLEAQLEEIKN